MKKTTNLQLQLWEGTDYPNIMIPNNNMLTLDSTYGDLKVGFDAVNDELADIGSSVSGLSERITENAQAVEVLDDFDTKLKKELYKVGLEDIKRIKIVETDFKTTLNEQVKRTSPIATVKSGAFTIDETSNRAIGFQEFFMKGTIDLRTLFGNLTEGEHDIVLLASTILEKPSTKSGHIALTPLRYDPDTEFLIVSGEETVFSTLSVDASGNISGYVDGENFYNTEYHGVFILASV